MITKDSIIYDLRTVRTKSPLVHNITNYVVMNSTANALLALGASPVMAHALDEVEDMVRIASSLVINIGTLSKHWIEAMIKAGQAANKKGIPVILDPVGSGATPFRTETSIKIIKECKPQVIRGNASEIMSLANEKADTKGVDSIASSDAAVKTAVSLAKDTEAVVVISGAIDYIVDDQSVIKIKNGSSLMSRVTGLGCTASAIVGAFTAVNKNILNASAHAMAVMGIAGEIAAKRSDGPGTLQVCFLDELFKLSEKDIRTHFND